MQGREVSPRFPILSNRLEVGLRAARVAVGLQLTRAVEEGQAQGSVGDAPSFGQPGLGLGPMVQSDPVGLLP